MRVYFMGSEGSAPENVQAAVAAAGHELRALPTPESPDGLGPLEAEEGPAIVFLPAVWKDLFSVKLTQRLRSLPGVFEVVMYGKPPRLAELCVAFNEGLAYFLDGTAAPDMARQALSRAARNVARRLDERRIKLALEAESAEEGELEQTLLEQQARDQLIAKAFMDCCAHRGPFVERTARVLVVSTSTAQLKRLEAYLKPLGVEIVHAASAAAALGQVRNGSFAVVVSDNVLPDGAATELAAKIKAAVSGAVPAFIVWTSSRENKKLLLDPKYFVDAVALKPEGSAGMDSLLLELVAGVYRQRA